LCYDEARERLARLAKEEPGMQTLSNQRSNGLSPQTRRIAVFAIILFALSGLISGFAMGAFVRPKIGGITNNGNNSASITQQTKTANPGSVIRPQKMYYPKVDHYSHLEHADGQTLYLFSAHATDVNGNPLHAAGITCKLWLTKNQIIPEHNEWSPVGALSNPVTGEIPNSLIFDSSTSQTQQCNGNGQAIWKYQVAQTVDPGTYYLAVVTDWAGVHFNIWWQEIEIKKAN
jgi:hypothetical protein